MIKYDTLYTAVDHLKNQVNLKVNLERFYNPQKGADAKIKIGAIKAFHAIVKGEIHRTNLPSILEELNSLPSQSMLLIAKSISSFARTLLRNQEISYLDLAGNCFLKSGKNFYVLIEKDKAKKQSLPKKHSTFNKNGIKLIFALLRDESLMNKTYDEMATAANISKSTIGDILKDLKNKQLLVQVNKKTRRLNNKKVIIEQWVKNYNEKLKPSLFRGKFSFMPNHLTNWKGLLLGAGSYWGGEPAAELLTDFLAPEDWTLYSDESQSDLMSKYKLIPNPKDGNVDLYSVFWNEQDEIRPDDLPIANPLLVYADLIGTKDSRNFEAATKIYEQELRTYFTE